VSVALASGGLAASHVHQRERRASERLGPGVAVLVATRDLAAGARVTRGAVGLRQVPARFVPPDALGSAAAVAGARVSAPVPAGGFLTAGLFTGEAEASSRAGVRRGERAVTVGVTTGSGIEGIAPGTRVDVLVSSETGARGGRTVMALGGVELLRLAGGTGSRLPAEEPAATGPAVLATLRVSLQQAIYLTAADNFAREIRLLARPPGDHSRVGGEVAQQQL